MPLPAAMGVAGALVGSAATSWYYAGRVGYVFDREYYEGELGLPHDMVAPPTAATRRRTAAAQAQAQAQAGRTSGGGSGGSGGATMQAR
jgi:hypothetical protein